MTHTDAATSALRDAVYAATRQVAAAVTDAQRARAEVAEAEDLVPLIGAAAGLALALEAMQQAAKDAEAGVRRAMADAMSLGATTVQTQSLTVSLRNGARKAIVTDAAAIPAELWITPEPKPDLTEIAKRLRAGEQVPGATLSNGAEMIVAIKTRKAA